MQKECDAVMKDKLSLRRVFVDEQKTKDEEFVKELRKQADDIGAFFSYQSVRNVIV